MSRWMNVEDFTVTMTKKQMSSYLKHKNRYYLISKMFHVILREYRSSSMTVDEFYYKTAKDD